MKIIPETPGPGALHYGDAGEATSLLLSTWQGLPPFLEGHDLFIFLVLLTEWLSGVHFPLHSGTTATFFSTP